MDLTRLGEKEGEVTPYTGPFFLYHQPFRICRPTTQHGGLPGINLLILSAQNNPLHRCVETALPRYPHLDQQVRFF